jgi:hypothetical protein
MKERVRVAGLAFFWFARIRDLFLLLLLLLLSLASAIR